MVILSLAGHGETRFFGYEGVCFLLFRTHTKWKTLLSAIFEILVVLIKPSTKFPSQILLLF